MTEPGPDGPQAVLVLLHHQEVLADRQADLGDHGQRDQRPLEGHHVGRVGRAAQRRPLLLDDPGLPEGAVVAVVGAERLEPAAQQPEAVVAELLGGGQQRLERLRLGQDVVRVGPGPAVALAVGVVEADLQGPGRADVLLHAQVGDVRELLYEHGRGAVGGAVVDHHDLVDGPLLGPQPLEGPAEHVAALEGDHHRGDGLLVHSGTTAPPAARLRGTASRTLRTRRPDSPSVRAGRPSLTAAASSLTTPASPSTSGRAGATMSPMR